MKKAFHEWYLASKGLSLPTFLAHEGYIDSRQAINCLHGRWKESSPVGTVDMNLS
jgi:hypothetical protein